MNYIDWAINSTIVEIKAIIHQQFTYAIIHYNS